MISFKQFVEGSSKKQRKLRAKATKERLKNIKHSDDVPDKFDMADKYWNIWSYKDRYFVDTDHARNDRRMDRGVQYLTDKDLLVMLKRSADYMYDRGTTFLSKKDGNYMFYSRSYEQGFIIKVEPHRNWKARAKGKKMDFTVITWLTHGDDTKPQEADKRIYIESVSNEVVKYLNDVIVESNEKYIIFEGMKIPFENVIEID